MRILYHHRTRSTDAQRIHILEMIHAFEELGHQVEVAGLVDPETGKQDAARDAGVPLWKRLSRRVPWGTEIIQLGYNVVGLPMLAAKLLRHRPDFIYERYALFNFTGVLLARLFRIPIILEVNGAGALEHKRDGDIRGYRLALWSERAICNAATYVIAISTPLRRILIDSGIRPEKIVVMANGINPHHFRRDPAGSAELRHRYYLEGKTIVGFVGWFRDWHQLDTLIAAFHQAYTANPNLRLLMIGDGPQMPDLRSYVQTHHLEEAVIFTGPIPHDDVPPYLDLLDVAIQPAANEYCCPMKILEYMFLGKPVIGPRQENIEELVDDGVTGWLFTPGSLEAMTGALKRISSDPEAIARMGKSCLDTVQERDLFWTGNARKVLKLVHEAG
jgi:glycosyltransferase involved in cell wall biosynthesis